MSDPVAATLETKGLTDIRVERAPQGHITKVEARRADGAPVAVLMDEPREDADWIKAVWARADPEGFMAALSGAAEPGGPEPDKRLP